MIVENGSLTIANKKDQQTQKIYNNSRSENIINNINQIRNRTNVQQWNARKFMSIGNVQYTIRENIHRSQYSVYLIYACKLSTLPILERENCTKCLSFFVLSECRVYVQFRHINCMTCVNCLNMNFHLHFGQRKWHSTGCQFKKLAIVSPNSILKW